MSGASLLIRLLVASSFNFLPIPLQFQETIFIIYFYDDGLPWNPALGFLPSSDFCQEVSPEWADYPEACLCKFPDLSFL